VNIERQAAVTAERADDGKLRCTCTTWDDAVVIAPYRAVRRRPLCDLEPTHQSSTRAICVFVSNRHAARRPFQQLFGAPRDARSPALHAGRRHAPEGSRAGDGASSESRSASPWRGLSRSRRQGQGPHQVPTQTRRRRAGNAVRVSPRGVRTGKTTARSDTSRPVHSQRNRWGASALF
jgi:hypothetical protein